MEGFSGMDAGTDGTEGGNNKMAWRLCDMRSRNLGEKKLHHVRRWGDAGRQGDAWMTECLNESESPRRER